LPARWAFGVCSVRGFFEENEVLPAPRAFMGGDVPDLPLNIHGGEYSNGPCRAVLPAPLFGRVRMGALAPIGI
jgi:hypothetical protein